jgi:hypothetical protein
MSDARVFTSYIPRCAYNGLLQSENGIRTESQYRNFLQTNAHIIDRQQRRYVIPLPYHGTDRCPSYTPQGRYR